MTFFCFLTKFNIYLHYKNGMVVSNIDALQTNMENCIYSLMQEIISLAF